MFRRFRALLALLLVLVLALSACGDGDDEPTPEAAGATPATQEPSAAVAATTALPSAPLPTSAPAGVNGGPPVSDQVSLNPAEELPTVEVVKLLTPSVVQIVTETPAMGAFNQPVPSQGVGTGVILDTAGHILTSNHVIAGAQTITVILDNGDIFTAEVVGRDPTTDTAVISIEASGLRPAKLGNSSELQVGEDVIAIGHALGLPGGPTVSKGVVSALGRSIDTEQQNTIVDLIQTDAEINPGNSGGALVNSRAEVVGINTAIITGGRGIGFAINIDDAKVVVAQLIENGSVERGFLGITPVNLTAGLAERLAVAPTPGILVARVVDGTAADPAGLMEGDVIVELGDERIINTGELSKFLLAHPPGETVTIEFFRGERRVTTEITLGERPTG